IGREPIVSASIRTWVRAFSTEKRGACRLQAPKQSSRMAAASRRRIRDRLAERGSHLKELPPEGAPTRPFGLLDSDVPAERLEVIVVIARSEIGAEAPTAARVHLHRRIALQGAAEAVEIDVAAGGVRETHRNVSAERFRVDRAPCAVQIHFAGERFDLLRAANVLDGHVAPEHGDVQAYGRPRLPD